MANQFRYRQPAWSIWHDRKTIMLNARCLRVYVQSSQRDGYLTEAEEASLALSSLVASARQMNRHLVRLLRIQHSENSQCK